MWPPASLLRQMATATRRKPRVLEARARHRFCYAARPCSGPSCAPSARRTGRPAHRRLLPSLPGRGRGAGGRPPSLHRYGGARPRGASHRPAAGAAATASPAAIPRPACPSRACASCARLPLLPRRPRPCVPRLPASLSGGSLRTSKFHAPYVARLRAALGVPVVVHLHNGPQTADGPESLVLSRLLLRSARRVIAVSPAVADYARRVLPAHAERVTTVPNGIDPPSSRASRPRRARAC